MRQSPLLRIQPEELSPAGRGNIYGDLASVRDGSLSNGRPGSRGEIRGGLQSEPGVVEPGDIGRPRQNNVGSGRSDGQLRRERKTKHRALAVTAAITPRGPIQRVA